MTYSKIAGIIAKKIRIFWQRLESELSNEISADFDTTKAAINSLPNRTCSIDTHTNTQTHKHICRCAIAISYRSLRARSLQPNALRKHHAKNESEITWESEINRGGGEKNIIITLKPKKNRQHRPRKPQLPATRPTPFVRQSTIR